MSRHKGPGSGDKSDIRRESGSGVFTGELTREKHKCDRGEKKKKKKRKTLV